MIKRYLFLVIFISLIERGFAQGTVEDELPMVTAKIRFINEIGVPLPEVQSDAGCRTFTGNDKLLDKGVSDADGFCVFKFKALSRIGVRTKKDGYYQSIAPARNEFPPDMRFSFEPFIYDGIDPRSKRDVEPPMKKEVNLEASVTLREIRNPIPLYVKRVRMDIPARDVWLGYDFEVGDWVKPHGEGISSDLRIRSAPKRLDPADPNKSTLLPGVATLEIGFGKDGGIIRVTKDNGWLAVSEMKMPHLAPEAGYNTLPTLKIEQTGFGAGTSSEYEKAPDTGEYLLAKANGYFFRTRVRREGEKIVSANYGKLMGNINYRPAHLDGAWWGDKKKNAPAFGSIEFTYYFNPTANDRNLEFDVKKNSSNGVTNG